MNRLLLVLLLISPFTAQAQLTNKVQLEDVSIKGEAVRTNGLNLSSRARNTLDGRIQMRKDFRDRILEDLPNYYNSRELDSAAGSATQSSEAASVK